ncbi:translation elongation factor Ts [bacterium endosymbiont of Pedicinus badii]|uniref:translation elongation factor Ts n=1 Tax=bacterium endosymbiont of Pedicinus badii TaxID=1719126 RepID=UPI0009BB7B6A|nr:translation elongation factor Ts [bacterium endosymbiont of Pedicinus badii]OQM34000.1 hypothetical protein AOQ89_01400 [bacterium endosymbiont of Pedicinus badii]
MKNRFYKKKILELRNRTDVGIVKCKNALEQADYNIEKAVEILRNSGFLQAEKKFIRPTKEGVILTKISESKDFGTILEINCETDFASREKNFLIFSKKIVNFIIKNRLYKEKKIREIFEEERRKLIFQLSENINIRRISILKGNYISTYLHNKRIGVILSSDIEDTRFSKEIAMHIAASKPKYLDTFAIPKEVLKKETHIQKKIAKKLRKNQKITKKIVEGKVKKFSYSISLMKQPFIMNTNKTVGDILEEKKKKIYEFIRFELGEYT